MTQTRIPDVALPYLQRQRNARNSNNGTLPAPELRAPPLPLKTKQVVDKPHRKEHGDARSVDPAQRPQLPGNQHARGNQIERRPMRPQQPQQRRREYGELDNGQIAGPRY